MNSITPFSIYLFGILDGLKVLAVSLVLVELCIFIVSVILTEGEAWTRYKYVALSTIFFCCLLAVFIPSSKTYAAMVILPKIAQSDVIKKDVPEMYEAAKNLLLDKNPEK